MKTVPLANGGGTIPMRASKNPVLGVFRHHCGELASVHQPKGKRSGTRYLICDGCGTDQCGGTNYQAKIKAGTYHSIEALQAAENAVRTVKADAEVKAVVELVVKPEVEPVVEPLQAAPHAAQTVNQPIENNDPILSEKVTALEPTTKPLQAAPSAVSTVKTIPDAVEPKPNATPPNDVKPMRIGLAAIFGGLIGGLLAVVA